MRTSVDLPDMLFRELKALAGRRGTSLKTLIIGAVEVELRKDQVASTHRVKFPLLDSSRPGTLSLTNADIEDLLT